jgi:hypothetical protein
MSEAAVLLAELVSAGLRTIAFVKVSLKPSAVKSFSCARYM